MSLAARKSIERIKLFADAYVEFIQAAKRRDIDSEWLTQQKMARISQSVQSELDRVGCGQFVLIDAPARGGHHYDAQVTGVAVHVGIAQQYDIDPRTIVLILQQAMGEYERRAEAPESRLVSSFAFVSLVAVSALRLLVTVIRTLLSGWRLLAMLVVFLIGMVAFIANLQQIGWLDQIRRNLAPLGLGIP
ncbi:MAG: hypothetical protein EPO26_07355 [Chloroflexota bacterium]|nr:MAG: hypothetical protein EPO26_07355 [Chloroflexota bacterium]